MDIKHGRKSIWWREPMVWLIMALPLTAVVAGLTTVWIAFTKADKIIGDSSTGIEVTQANEMDKRAHYLRLTADIDASHGLLTLRLHGRRMQSTSEQLVLRVVHQADVSNTLLPLHIQHDGNYGITLPAMVPGACQVILEPTNHKWRLVGTWQTPFNGEFHLAAKSISDSSMLP